LQHNLSDHSSVDHSAAEQLLQDSATDFSAEHVDHSSAEHVDHSSAEHVDHSSDEHDHHANANTLANWSFWQ
jgi:hypothetical protein